MHHGPWAFVLSLTHWDKRRFTGGETQIMSDSVLNYWDHYESDATIDQRDIFSVFEPRFNQLLLFDPRVPHGVRLVRGTQDPREGRLVLTGWFLPPGTTRMLLFAWFWA